MSSKNPKKIPRFGSGGRINHDSSFFYEGRLHDQHPTENIEDPYKENPVPHRVLNTIFTTTSESMHQLPDDCIHLMVTSPPYNARKEYDLDLTLNEYLTFLRRVFQETYRVLVPGGRACINVANLGRKPYIPLNAFFTHMMIEIGFLMRGEIIWDKGPSVGSSTAWGSWLSASNPTLRDVHEYILIFSKGRFKREKQDRENSIKRDDFLLCTKSVWQFPTESAKRVGHPAPFPIELPRRLIDLYSFKNEIVLDPFMGSGTTALAAIDSGRHYIGYELERSYITLAKERIANHQNQL